MSFLRCLSLLLLIASTPLVAVPPMTRPVPSRGPDARTLIVFSAARAAYSLGHELEFLKLQLGRIATPLEAIPVADATSTRLAAADYLVVFCPQPNPVLATNFLQALAVRHKPVLWVGFGAEQLAKFPPFTGKFETAPGVDHLLKRVSYQGRNWNFPGAWWSPMLVTARSGAQSIMGPPDPGGQVRLSLCWKLDDKIFFTAVPAPGPLSFLFADLLLDFYGASSVHPASDREIGAPRIADGRLFFRIDDYQAASDHRGFLRRVDFLFSRGHPFLVSITPSWRNPETGALEDLDSAPEFVAGLRYAQQRGGRMVLRGCVREPGERGEFWDTDLDRPLPEEKPEMIRRQLAQATMLLLKHGLLPLAWQTPQDAASRAAYAEIARVFSTAVERPQLGDATHLDTGLASAPTMDRHGRLIVPENLGYVSGEGTDPYEEIRSRAELLLGLRGTIAGCFIHAYLPFERLTGLMAQWSTSTRGTTST